MLACLVSFFLFPVTVLPKISLILFLNEKLRKTAVNPPNFLGLSKNVHQSGCSCTCEKFLYGHFVNTEFAPIERGVSSVNDLMPLTYTLEVE
jgi:hypothetical protein